MAACVTKMCLTELGTRVMELYLRVWGCTTKPTIAHGIVM